MSNLNEVSSKLAKRYMRKAGGQYPKLERSLNKLDPSEKEFYKRNKKLYNREKGIKSASWRAAGIKIKEDKEQLSELSKGVLGSYVKKASSELFDRGYSTGKDDHPKRKKDYDKKFRRNLNVSVNREKGIERASNKLVKEETKMDNIRAAIKSIQEGNLEEMNKLFTQTLYDKSMVVLENRKNVIAQTYFGKKD